MAVVSLAIYFGRIWKMPIPNQVIALTVLSVTVPPISCDYTLLALYVPFGMLSIIALHYRDERIPFLSAYFVLFAFILTPENYFVFHHAILGGQVRCLALLAVLALSCIRELPPFRGWHEREHRPSGGG